MFVCIDYIEGAFLVNVGLTCESRTARADPVLPRANRDFRQQEIKAKLNGSFTCLCKHVPTPCQRPCLVPSRLLLYPPPAEGDHVLEVGCGWGSFAMRAAQRTGCR